MNSGNFLGEREDKEFAADGVQRLVLCPVCAEREGDEVSLPVAKNGECFVCRGLTTRLDAFVKRAINSARKYDFSKFSVGMILPVGVQEREDEVRSKYRIRGRETIKVQLSKEFSKKFSKISKKKVEKLSPDLTIIVDAEHEQVWLGSKSLYVSGRYAKPAGIAQRRSICEVCSGRGCNDCGDTGYQRVVSVEESIQTRLGPLLKSDKMKFTWIGSEDSQSTVLPPGRPFVIEVKNPVKRKVPARLLLRTRKGTVRISRLNVLRGRPTSIPAFVFKTKVTIRCDGSVQEEDLKALRRQLRNVPVQYRNNKGRLVYKRVYFVRASKNRGTVTAEIKLDGGLPVKRLITGDSVSPSFSELLKTPLTCQRFDILRVWESGGFEFGKI